MDLSVNRAIQEGIPLAVPVDPPLSPRRLPSESRERLRREFINARIRGDEDTAQSIRAEIKRRGGRMDPCTGQFAYPRPESEDKPPPPGPINYD